MTHSESTVLKMLEAKVADAGSLRALAKKIGCSAAYLSDVLRGNRYPGPIIADFLGLKRTVWMTREATYEPLPKRK